MLTYQELRKKQYDYQIPDLLSMGIDIDDFKKNPYASLKLRFYLESGVILVYFLQRTNIKPNTVTITYGLLGILGCLLMALPYNGAIITALVIFFMKAVLDISDGLLARTTGRTSITGEVLDPYGAFLNTLGFQMGVGFYVAGAYGSSYLYLLPALTFFHTVSLKHFGERVLFNRLIRKKLEFIPLQDHEADAARLGYVQADRAGLGRYKKYYQILTSYLDDRSRTVDTLCLIILIELYFPLRIMNFIFILLVLKQFLIFSAHFYSVAWGGWTEGVVKKVEKDESK